MLLNGGVAAIDWGTKATHFLGDTHNNNKSINLTRSIIWDLELYVASFWKSNIYYCPVGFPPDSSDIKYLTLLLSNVRNICSAYSADSLPTVPLQKCLWNSCRVIRPLGHSLINFLWQNNKEYTFLIKTKVVVIHKIKGTIWKKGYICSRRHVSFFFFNY